VETNVLLGKKTFTITQSRLRDWLFLEDIRVKISKAADIGDGGMFISSIYGYISAALSISVEELSELPWLQIADTLATLFTVNAPGIDFPLLKSKSQESTAIWDYEGRTWYLWAHILADAYGWSIEYIENLRVDDAVAFIQEILVEDQLTREWEWSTSEIAYSYDSATKKSKFNPLPRPSWMGEAVGRTVKKMKVKKSMLPVGNVLTWEDIKNADA
jgi:hypothetical protein